MDKFKADMEMLVGKQICVSGFENIVIKTVDGDLNAVKIDGICDGVDFEVTTFSKVLTEYLEKMPKSWFPFVTHIVKRTSDAGFDYYAFGRKA